MPRQKTSPTQSDYEALAAFRYALRQFLHFSEDMARSAGVTPQQHQALLAIKGFPAKKEITVGELAERLQIQHHSAVGLVNRLAAEKLVRRIPTREDRRQVRVVLTAQGEKKLERLSSLHQGQIRDISPQLTELLRILAGAQPRGRTKAKKN
jgi:DNA-binding MarR family transcriptional regulator